MPVYMIRAGTNGPVKIGRASNPDERIAALQTAHYEDLHFIRIFEGGDAEEKALHVRFADLRIKREWFAFSRLMLGDLSLTDIPQETPAEQAPDAPSIGDMTAREIISELGGAVALGLALKRDRNVVTQWYRIGIPGKYWPEIARLASREPRTAHITLDVLEQHTSAAKAA